MNQGPSQADNNADQLSRTGRILVVNDSPVQIERLQRMLSNLGYEVRKTGNAVTAWEVARTWPPDLVISDVVMPGMDGVELCRRIKADSATASIPVLLITGLRYDNQGVIDGLDAGADDYLELDAPSSLLVRKVGRLMEQIKERRSREAAEAALRDSEKWFRLLIESSYELIAIVSADGVIGREGAGLERLLGYRAEEVTGKPLLDFVHEDDTAVVKGLLENVREDAANSAPAEARFIHRDKSWRWMELAGSNFIHEPSLAGVLLHAHDISAQKTALDDLRRAVDLKEAIFQGSRDAIFISDHSSNFVIVNSAACELTGYSEEELLRMKIPDLHDEVDLDAFRMFHQRIMDGEPLMSDAQIRRKDGIKIYAEFNNHRVVISNSYYMHTVARDVSARKSAEEALRRSEERYRLLFERNVAGIFCTTPSGRVVDCNEAFVNLLGYDSREEVLQENSTNFHISPEVRVRILEILREEGTIIGLEPVLRRKDGSIINLVGNVTLLAGELNEEPALYGTLIDISARKQAEEQLKEFAAKLERSNEELAQFAYIASHDLQEPLRKVQAFAERLEAKYGDQLPEEGHDYLNRMVAAAKRMQVLITDLLQLSRVTTKGAPFVHTDLGQILRDVVSDLEIQIETAGATVSTGYLPTIEADPTQMRQLFQNIIGNALKFRRADASPQVKVKYQIEQTWDRRMADSAAQICRILIEDNGIGFDSKYSERIFSPFQRLHGRAEYDGTGIGLAVCKRIIERHGGVIAAESVLGAGSTFIVTLPVRQHSPGAGD